MGRASRRTWTRRTLNQMRADLDHEAMGGVGSIPVRNLRKPYMMVRCQNGPKFEEGVEEVIGKGKRVQGRVLLDDYLAARAGLVKSMNETSRRKRLEGLTRDQLRAMATKAKLPVRNAPKAALVEALAQLPADQLEALE